MGFKRMLILLLGITFTSLSRCLVESIYGKENFQESHAIKSIQSEDGDIIDCINIYKQPSLSHPSLRNHKIQLAPSYDLMEATKRSKKSFSDGDSSKTITSQIWHKSGSCPEGTIPIRRARSNGMKRGKYGRKRTTWFQNSNNNNNDGNNIKQLNDSNMLYLLQPNHSMSILLALGFAYLGAKGDIKVWNPPVELDDDYSTSRVALKSGPRLDYQAIESGWAVNPSVYGDRQTRIYVYWTADGSQKTGCFDLTCPGFIQTSNEIALGGAIHPISNPTGLPYQMTIYIHKDPNTSNWWVQYGERINIGYWPPDLFEMLRLHAQTVQWGGEVYSTKVGTHPHTATGMGSGRFSDYVFQSSGYVKRMRVLRNNMELEFPKWVSTYSDEYFCYDFSYLTDYVEEPEFYYGGPGRSYRCP